MTPDGTDPAIEPAADPVRDSALDPVRDRGGIDIAVLALLAEQPADAAALAADLVSRRHDRIVRWDRAALAAAIARMRAQDLIAGEGPEGASGAEGLLHLTPAGREVLVEWTRASLSDREEERPRFDLALLTAHSVPVAVAREALSRRLADLDEATSQLTTRIRTSARRGLSEAYGMQADYRRSLLIAEFRWLSRLLERIDAGELTWTEGEAPQTPPETV